MKLALLNQLRSMTESDIYRAMYCDHLTGLLNRRAFDSDQRPFVAVVDADSLKYVNDSFGYRWGDCLIETVGKALATEFGEENVYRIGGDEFAVRSEHAVTLRQKLITLRSFLPCFSFGLGFGIERADRSLKEDKLRRERSGLRAERGECPPWIDQITEQVRCV